VNKTRNAAKLLIDFALEVERPEGAEETANLFSASDKDEARDSRLKGGFAVNYTSPESRVAQTECAQTVFHESWRN